jgi:hypothetical protein
MGPIPSVHEHDAHDKSDDADDRIIAVHQDKGRETEQHADGNFIHTAL